jgi:hypothetical protein
MLYSAGPNETLLLLANLSKAIARAYSACPTSNTFHPQGASPLKTLDAWCAGVKQLQGMISVRDIFGLMLCAVAGAGETVVEAILARYPTWHDLWAEYKLVMESARARGQDASKAAEGILASIPVGMSGLARKSRRTVGPDLSKKVFCNLFKVPPRPPMTEAN